MATQNIEYTLADCGSVVNGTPKDIIVAVPSGTCKLIFKVAVKYAAVAGTSGVAVTFKYSLDGSTYTASAVTGSTIAPAATVLGSAVYEIGVEDLPTRKDPGGVEDYEVILTNTDATNSAIYDVSYHVV